MIMDFIYQYYIDPIHCDQAYNIVNTLTYAIILILVVFLLYRWFSRAGIAIDREFSYALIPWMVFGGLLRVIEDTGMITTDWHYLLITPLIFFVIFIYALIVFLFSIRLEPVLSYPATRIFGVTGFLSALVTFIILLTYGTMHNTLSIFIGGTILIMALTASALVYGCMRFLLGWEYVRDRLYQVLIFAHMLDASATSYGIDLHDMVYVEKHVVGANLIALTGTAFVMYPLKLLILFPAIYILQEYRKDGTSGLWHLILLAMIMVGLAPGIRDLMRMVLYT
ncbi:MAG: DUF63 family protein [Methanospirillaceae archaeon]|nr:DUF63 family protein [Methanospirillaceae archaeon]